MTEPTWAQRPVARLCQTYGWTMVGDRTHVWACIDRTRPGPYSGAPRSRDGAGYRADGRRSQ